MPNDARIEELSQDAAARIKCASTTSEWLIVIEEALRAAIREAREGQTFTHVGWLQVIHTKLCFFEGPLDPREVHDSGKPCFPVFVNKSDLPQLPTKKG